MEIITTTKLDTTVEMNVQYLNRKTIDCSGESLSEQFTLSLPSEFGNYFLENEKATNG